MALGDMDSTAVNASKRVTSDLSDAETHWNDSPVAEVGPKKYPFPKTIFFIIGNEFCERFNFFGMRAILVLYLTQKLKFDADTATVLYHGSGALVYFLCIFGAIISDCWLGKFKTILYLSVVYALGSLLIAIGAIPTLHLPAVATTIIGLLLVGIGSGGIKSSITAFGGDQFKLPEQNAKVEIFIAIFSFTINVGALIATFTIPILRYDVHCFGEADCYSLAFGVPGVLMVLSIIIFVSGKPYYKIIPPSRNVLSQVAKCIKHAIVTKRYEEEPRKHWLDYSEQKFGKQLVTDTKAFLRILSLYIPLPLFWALVDQQGSRWTIQATKMSGNIGFYDLKPDQMPAVTPFLTLIFIPTFQAVIYPLVSKIGIRRPLQKMSIGMCLAAISFLLSGIVELELEKTYPVLPAEGQAQLRFINGLPCNFTISENIPRFEQFKLNRFEMLEGRSIDVGLEDLSYGFELKSAAPNCPREIRGSVRLVPNKATTVFVSGPEIKENDDNPEKSGSPMLRILFSSLGEVSFREVRIITPSRNDRVALVGNTTHRQLFSISSGVHEIHIDGRNYETIELKDGSVSELIVLETSDEQEKFQIHLVEITASNSMSVLWQLPQYIAITMGEVVLIIPGVDFSYTQAPASLKSVMLGCWLTTIAFGNLIMTIIAGARIFPSQASEFFLFAGLVTLGALLFMVLAKNYKCENAAGLHSKQNSIPKDDIRDVSNNSRL